MGAFANIAATDAEATPVTHTFTPNGLANGGVANWINRNAAVPSASELVELIVKPSPANPADYQVPGRLVAPRKATLTLKYPITYTDAVSGLTLVDFINLQTRSGFYHPRSTEQQCKNARTVIGGLAALTAIASAFDIGEPIY